MIQVELLCASEAMLNALQKVTFRNEIQELMPTRAEQSGHSIAGIMLPHILNSSFPIVGTVNNSDYKKYFYTNESLRQSFTNIEVEEVTLDDALYILETKINSLEDNFHSYVTFPALIAAVELAHRYIKERKLPSSAVQTIESACSWAQANNIEVLTAESVAKAISIQKKINVTAISTEETTDLMKLEENIRKRVIGQDEAVFSVVDALRRARTDVRNPNKPIGAYLFMGPTGVGKTHIAKVVCEEFFGEDHKMIRADMSEYQEKDSVKRMIGAPASGEGGVLTEAIKNKPFALLLLDEIEF